jgi:hypothetical protein
MGRKQSNTVDYFPHFAEPGKTVFILKSRFGNDGYAFWFQLLEVLCKEENHFYDCRGEAEWQYLLARTGVSEETGRELLNILATLGKIDRTLWQKKVIWCSKLVVNLADVYKKRERVAPGKPSIAAEPITDTETPISGAETGVSGAEMPQSKVKYTRVDNNTPSKEGARKKSTNNKKDATVKEIFLEMQDYLGFPKKITEDPIPSYGREGQAVKRMLARGFTREAIVQCWKSKVSQRGGEFVSMTWVNEDIGKPEVKLRGVRRLSTEEEIAASIRKATT